MSDVITPIENEIVAQLNVNVDNCRIDNDPKRRQATSIARALIWHDGETPGQTAMNGRSQPTELRFSIDVQLADQRIGGHQKIYPVLASIKNALIGFQPSCASPLQMTANDYQEMPLDSGIQWRYLMRFSCDTTWIKS